MKHEADTALALSDQGEQLFQSAAAKYPDLAREIAKANTYHADGGILRHWERVDYSGDFESLINDLIALNPGGEHYRLATVSEYGGAWEHGSFDDPFGLKLRTCDVYEVDFDSSGKSVRRQPEPEECRTDGNDASQPKLVDAAAYGGRPGIIFEQFCTFSLDAETALDEEALRQELRDLSISVRLGFVENVADESDGITGLAEANPGKSMNFRMFVRVEPVSEDDSEA